MSAGKCAHDSESPHGSIVYVRVNGKLVWAVCRACGRTLGAGRQVLERKEDRK